VLTTLIGCARARLQYRVRGARGPVLGEKRDTSMLYFKYALAAALLTAPPDSIELTDAAGVHGALASALKAVAIDWEILDPRENRYVLAQPEEFPADLKLLQGRYRELVNAPRLEECARLPERKLVIELMAFNRAYRNDVAIRLTLDTVHEEELRAALTETDQLYRIWDAVRDARCDYYYITVRRQALQQLRDLVGAPAYYSGVLPPHVPVWRFPVLDR
jgi:hypothetical protein